MFVRACEAFERMPLDMVMCCAAGVLLVLLGWSERRRQDEE